MKPRPANRLRAALRLEALEGRITPADALPWDPRGYEFADGRLRIVTPRDPDTGVRGGKAALPPVAVPPPAPTPVPPPAAPTPTPPPATPIPVLPPPVTPVPKAATPLPLNDGSHPYWTLRQSQIEARIQQGHANVLFLGDSITDGLERMPVWDRYFEPLGAANFGVAAATTSHVLWQVRTGQVAAVTPDVVVLMIGTNNLGEGQSAADTAVGIATIVGEIRAQLPQTRIILLGLLPRGHSPADPFRWAVAQVNRRIAPLADGDRVRYLDMGPAFLESNGTIAPAVMADFLHPTARGYQIYAGQLWPLLAASLPKDPPGGGAPPVAP